MHSHQEEAKPTLSEKAGQPALRTPLQKETTATDELARLMRIGRDIRENRLVASGS